MMPPHAASIQHSIAANKFYPPRINKSQSIDRHTIIADRTGPDDSPGSLIIVEAQAGQGKTTLVHQYLEHSGIPYIWYQIGVEDNDPVVLLTALNLAFSRKLDNFFSFQLETILENGQIGPLDFQGCANILLSDIDASLTEDIFVVLDDLHLLSEARLTNELLDYLIDTSPPFLHYILISRHPLKLEARTIRKNPQVIYLNSDDLALNLEEIEHLYNDILKLSIGRTEAQQILEITNGWIMGIVLAANPLETSKRLIQADKIVSRGNHLFGKKMDTIILKYFEDEILTQIPERFHQAFVTLSFLDEINVDFACSLVGIEDLGEHLGNIADQNFFVYRLGDKSGMFRFHHLFQEFLQAKGRQFLDLDTIAAIHSQAADYYLRHDLVEKALKELRLGEDFERMEEVLKEHGLKLISANRTVTILGILQTISQETLFTHVWLGFFHALLVTDFQPQTTLPYFQACIETFIENGEEVGELLALSQIIYFHFVISGRYNDGSYLLGRTRELFESLYKQLPRNISILVVRNLAAGFCFFNGEMELAKHYAKLGCDLAERLGSRNFLASSRFILCYIELLRGDGRRARMEIEKSHTLVSDPLVGMSNRLTLHVMQLCELSMYGRLESFSFQKNLMLEGIDREVIRQTVAAPYLYVWSAIGLISVGRLDEARDLLEQGMFVSRSAESEHMTSQLLQWRALVYVLSGNKQGALDDIDLATEMRRRAGGPFFAGYHYNIKGAVLAFIGQFDLARHYLEKALAVAAQIPSPYIRVCAMAYLCYVDIKQGDELAADRRLRALLELMKGSGYDYFWGWEPGTMQLLLTRALHRNIEPDFARKLAQKRLLHSIDTQGELLPMLEIRLLGRFSISLKGEELFSLENFSTNQRELLGLLISSPNHQISQDQVELALWPDSPPDKASKTFYTLLSRLRKVLSEKIDDPTRYLIVEKSYVQLRNVSVDSAEFLELAREGLSLGKRELWWQAGNAFSEALSIWENFDNLSPFKSDQAVGYIDEIHHALRKISLTWARALAAINHTDEALNLLEKVGKVLLSDEDRVALQHQLYMKKKNPLKAEAVLDSYRRELLRLGYDENEVDEIMISLLGL